MALRVAYDGTRFRGLARQPGHDTVEDALIAALDQEGYVARSLRCGSRTDAGVSALDNVLRATLDRPHLKGLVPALARHLPDGLWVTAVAPVAADWSVRQARARTYHYLAPQNGESLPGLEAACRTFVGTHDFTAFARIEERDPVRPVTTFRVAHQGPFWKFEVMAPGFLWNQVRRMVDACLAVGQGRARTSDIEASLAGGEPHRSFQIAPAEGLLLARVHYDPEPAWAPDAGSVPVERAQRALQTAHVRRTVAAAVMASADAGAGGRGGPAPPAGSSGLSASS